MIVYYKMAKIYTKAGDLGLTSTGTQRKIPKYSDIIDTLGDLDELSAHIGQIRTFTPSQIDVLSNIQQNIMDISSYIAMGGKESAYVLPDDMKEELTVLEVNIDLMTHEMPVLKNFIMIGNTPTESSIQIARAVCRRAERNFWKGNYNESAGTYLNRLSDYLFTLARYSMHMKDIQPSIYKCGLVKKN